MTIWFVPVAVRPDAAPMMIATTTFVAGMMDGMKKKHTTPAIAPIPKEIKGMNIRNFSLLLKAFFKTSMIRYTADAMAGTLIRFK